MTEIEIKHLELYNTIKLISRKFFQFVGDDKQRKLYVFLDMPVNVKTSVQFSSVQSLSRVRLFVTPYEDINTFNRI